MSGKVVSALMFDRVVGEKLRLERKCEEYANKIFELIEEIKQLKEKLKNGFK